MDVRHGIFWLLACTARFSGPTQAAEPPTLDFDIPAGPFAEAIIALSHQARIEILYASAEPVDAIQARAVEGHLSLNEALDRLLAGTGFGFEFEGPQAVLLRRLHSKPERLSARPILETSEGPERQDVLITGSALHGVLDLMSPLEFVNRADLERAPFATVQDALQGLPVNRTATRNEFLGGGENYLRGTAPNLRGLGHGATLVLINGQRPAAAGADASFTDLSTIPWSAVDHIEVLPDGASALYGSDAIAGVVNVILRDRLQGAETQLRTGYTDGGAAETQASQLFGGMRAGGRWLLGYQYSQRASLAARDRAFTASADKRPYGGSDFRSPLANPGNILDPLTLQPLWAVPRFQDGRKLTATQLHPDTINLDNFFADYDLAPGRRQHALFGHLSQIFHPALEGFVEGYLSQRRVTYRDFPFVQTLFVPSTNAFFVDPTGDAPGILMAYNFSDDLGPLEGDGRTLSVSATAGLQAQLARGWHAVLSMSHGSERMRFARRNQVNPRTLEQALADPDPDTAFNPFGDGSHTAAATLEALRLNTTDQAGADIRTLKAVLDGPLFALPAGNVQLALGSEWRGETLRRQWGREVPAEHYGRDNAAAFAELSVPLIGDVENARAVPQLELSLAGRFERYSDFGGMFNPRIGLRWMPSRAVKLRASWGSAFRAPALVDLYDTTNNASALVPLADPRAPGGSSLVAVIQGSNRNLREETAQTWSAGLDLAAPAFPDGTLSLTYFDVRYQNQVVQPGPSVASDILREEARWAPVIQRDPTPEALSAFCHRDDFWGSVAQCLSTSPAALIDLRLRNLSMTRTRGVDLRLDAPWSTRIGRFHFGLDLNHVLRFERAVTPRSGYDSLLDTPYQPVSERWRGVLEWNGVGPDYPGLTAAVIMNGTGRYRDPASKRAIRGRNLVDLQLRYAMPRISESSSTEFSLTVSNLFDTPPPFVNGPFGFDLLNAQPFGRVTHFSLQKRW